MRILCVCLGNICRSPTAEGILKSLAQSKGLDTLEFDSAGTSSYHTGADPDSRSAAHAKTRGYHLEGSSRQLTKEDFHSFDLLLAMDGANYDDMVRMCPDPALEKKIFLITDFCKVHEIDGVPDPYYKGDDGFEHVLDILEDACSQLLDRIAGGASF